MLERFERFYGMALSNDVLDAVTERLTDQETDDLVQAHIGRNWSYFGAVDKTLTGFVILDDTDDNFTLLDVRDGGQVWWQDHETRDLYLRTDSLDDYMAWRAAVAKARQETDDWVDEDEYLEEFAATEAKGSRIVGTSEMLDRFQWLVWCCAQPMQRDGVDTQSVDDLTRDSRGNFSWYWGERDIEGSFERELPTLAEDPHLAIYWLLHSIWFGEAERAERVIGELFEDRPPLLHAFVDAAKDIGPRHVLSAVPKFRQRKAHLALYEAFGLDAVDRARDMLHVMKVDPTEMSYLKAWQIVPIVEAGALPVEEVAEALEDIERGSLGEALLRVTVDNQNGAESSEAAKQLIAMLDEDVEWTSALECLWRSYQMVDGELVVPVIARLEKIDRYHQRVAQMTAEIAEATGSNELPSADAAAKRLESANELRDLLGPLFEDPEAWLSVTNSLPDHLKLPAAQRIIVWAEVLEGPAVGWALQQLMESDLDNRFDLMREGLSRLGAHECEALIERVRDEIEGPSDPRLDFLFEVLELPPPPPGDYSAEFAYDKKIKTAVLAIAPFATDPAVTSRVLDVLEKSESSKPRIQIVQKLLNMFEEETFIIPSFDDATARRTARALIEMKQDDDIHARNAAGHQLYRFRHTGAEDTIREALNEYGVKYAAGDDSLDDLVANLYASLRAMNTESSRLALIERLYDERRSYWRLGSAIGEISTPEVHRQILETLSKRPNSHAAAAYASSLANFVNSDSRLAELGKLVVDWPKPESEEDRRMLVYVLLETCAAALIVREHALVQSLWARAEKLGDEPFSPYSSIDRERDWVSPFEDEERAAALEFVISGEADAKVEELRASGAKAREAGEIISGLDDESLGLLAGTTLKSRVLDNPDSGEVIFEDRDAAFHYYDGYDAVEPDFTHVDSPAAEARSFFEGRSISERRMFWQGASDFIEYVRWGDRIVSYRGVNNGAFTTFGLICTSDERAAQLMASFCDHPPEGYAESDPYYLKGHGAVVRKYYRQREDGGYDSQYEAVLDGSFCWQDDTFASDDEAIAALEEYERETFAEFGGQIASIETVERLRRAEDLTFTEWLEKRKRNDSRDAAWHLRALEEIPNYLVEHELGHLLEGFTVTVDEPASAEDITAFADACSVHLADELSTTWAAVGSAKWAFGKVARRFFGPKEALARRESVRARTAQWATDDDPEDHWRHIDAICVDQDDTTTLMYIDREWDGRFCHAADAPESFHASSLSWTLATGMISSFVGVIVGRQPVLGMLNYGQRWHDDIRYERYEHGDRFWEILVDPVAASLATRAGKIGTHGRFDHPDLSESNVEDEAKRLIAAVLEEGFEKKTPEEGQPASREEADE